MMSLATFCSRIKNAFLILFALLFVQKASAQTTAPYFGKIHWINGFAKEISGENIAYFSAFPDYATTALLTRTTDGKKTIEWETAPATKNPKEDYVYFSWVAAHSSGSSGGNRNFDLYINDKKLLTFTTLPKNQTKEWIFKAEDGSALAFQQTKIDGANDSHGLAFLRLPKNKVENGKSIRLKVVGQAQNSNDWYMTFKFSFEEKVDVAPMPFLLKNGKQVIALTALHFGKEETLNVKVGKKEAFSFVLNEGINNFDLPINAVKQKDSILVVASSKEKTFVNTFVTVKPVVYRELHFIHHSHTDIGYSHLQPEVLRIHLQNINDALAMIEKTKNYPDEAKFKWNIESMWVVDNYLKQASPAQKEQFIQAVKSGSICLSALYANILTGMSQPEEMFHYTDFAQHFSKEYGIPINNAMISDIPGYAWTTVTALSKSGVKYFSSGPNFMGNEHPYLGDRAGHFVRTWGDKPVWWASPSGEEKVLFWAGGKGYSSWHGTAPGGIFDRGVKKISGYLNELTAKNYPYPVVQWRYNIVSDNGPIDPSISDFVKQWNEKYTSPKIVLDTTEKLFESFEEKYGKQLETVRGDISPYWEDGAVSTASEEGENRVNSLRLQQLTTLYSMLNPNLYNPQKFYDAWTNVILFHEHTWGAHNSITQPDIPFVTEQWRIKKQFMLDANEQINALEKLLLQPISNPLSKKIAVFNTSSWKRTGAVVIPASVNGKSVKDNKGNLIALQKTSDGNYVFIAQDVPALGAVTYEITDKEAPISASNFAITENSLSNGKIQLEWDKNTGSIISLKAGNDFNYAGNFNNQGLNSYWYVPGLNPADAVSNGNAQIKILENGTALTKISITSDAPGANKLERVVSLYTGSDNVLIENKIDKKAIRTKESVHFGFPFNTTFNKTTLDAGYGSIRYLEDQLPGSNMDYMYGRRWVDVSGADKGIQWLLLEMPLVEPNMIDERLTMPPSYKEWKKEGKPTSTWFSYVMNNYWHTNYKIDQGGMARMRYALRPHNAVNEGEIEKAAAEFTQPLVALPISDGQLPASLFELTNNKIVVTSITPNADGGFLIRMFNPENTVQQTQFVWKSLTPKSIIEKTSGNIKPSTAEVKLAAKGVSEFLLKK